MAGYVGDGAEYPTGSEPWIAQEEAVADQRARQDVPQPSPAPPGLVPVFDALPTSLICLHCHFEVSADDVALPLRHGVICTKCYARVQGTEKLMTKTLRRAVSSAANTAS